ncbi:uncharacterized protein LOC143450357 isoform X2 [Clavelina lepadiformis]|uniref:uncharacterized protein LOC143450357 isoform X2 n=1 Tax=Clavelina lepadiformis TaxID=159417 RepID=UPI004041D1CC
MVFENSSTLPMAMSKSVTSTNYEIIAQDPLKHVLTVVEKKIRNLDKRKVKLDGYRKMVAEGVALDPDQDSAVSKYDEVIGSLEFAKEICKVFSCLSLEVNKTQQLVEQREKISKEENDLSRSQFVAKSLCILRLFSSQQQIQQDFLKGKRNAEVLVQSEMDLLLRFCSSCLGLSEGKGDNLLDEADRCGEHLNQLYDASTEAICGSSYDVVHGIFTRICSCGYFEELPEFCGNVDAADVPNADDLSETSTSSLDDDDNEYADEQNQLPKEGIEFSSSSALNQNSNINETAQPFSEINQDSSFCKTDYPTELSSLQSGENRKPSIPFTDASHANEDVMNAIQPNSINFVSFQYDETQNKTTQQLVPTTSMRPTHTIEEVLADVQGEYNFLQDSMIEVKDNKHSLKYPDSTSGPQANVLNDNTNINQLNTTNPHNSVLQSSPFLSANTAPEKDNSYKTGQNISSNDLNFQPTHHLSNPNSNNAFASVYADQETDDSYAANRLSQGSESNMTSQVDNLGMGQTTFGNSENSYDRSNTSANFGQSLHSLDSYKTVQSDVNMVKTVPDSTYGSSPFNSMPGSSPQPFDSALGGNSIPDPIPLPSSQQVASQTLATSDPPAAHIPFPNEKLSGYKSYNSEPSTTENSNGSLPQDDATSAFNSVAEHHMSAGDAEAASLSLNQLEPKSQDDISKNTDEGSSVANKNTSANLSSSNKSSANQPYSGSRQNRMQTGYSGPAGNYRGNHMSRQQGQGMTGFYQRGGNYRPNSNRSYGNFDSMGHPKHFGGPGGGYQQHPQAIPPFNSQYSRPQDNGGYGGMQRRGGGGSGPNRGGGGRGYSSRGNMRNGGPGNYNRSRTFRPQNADQTT